MGDIPKKLYYSISEVADLTGVKPHVLRYWESEFPTLHPSKARSGSRRYRRGDIDEVAAIKELLYEQGFKIAGARRVRREAHVKGREVETVAPAQLSMGFVDLDQPEQLAVLKRQTREILDLVRELGGKTVQAAVKRGAKKKRPARQKRSRKREAEA
jgi:DNA-binding transcriptional MerR regulator